MADFLKQDGYWRWIGDPVIPPSLVELIESRIGNTAWAGQRCGRRAGCRGADRTGGAGPDH